MSDIDEVKSSPWLGAWFFSPLPECSEPRKWTMLKGSITEEKAWETVKDQNITPLTHSVKIFDGNYE